jgi:hypothetical protein
MSNWHPDTGSTSENDEYIEIDDVSVKEIRLSDSYVQTSWAAGNWKTAQPYIPQYAMSSYSKKMLFDGGDNLVDCGEGTAIDNVFDGGGTWSAWFSATTDGESNTGTILSKDKVRIRTTADGGGDVTMEFIHFFNTQEGEWTCPTDAVLLNKINHILIVYNNSSVSNNPIIYINGVSQTVTRDQAPIGTFTTDASDELTIGAKADDSVDCFDGFIDEVSVWGKELTAAEAQEIFNAGMALDCRDHSAYLGVNLISSSEFSSGVGDWATGGSGTIEHVTSFGGRSNVAKITTPTTHNLSNKVRHTFTAAPNAVYEVKLDVYVASGQFRVDSSDSDLTGDAGEHDIIRQEVTREWVTVSGIATGESGADTLTELWIRAQSGTSSLECYVDNVSVKEVDLKGYWRNNGLDDWTDLSPYGNDGDVQNAEVAEVIQLQEVPYFKKDTFGLPMNKVRQRALNFGGDDYMKITSDSSLDITNYSIDGWVYNTNNTIAWETILTKVEQDNFQIVIQNSKILYYSTADSSKSLANILTDAWTYFCITESAGTLKCYINDNSTPTFNATVTPRFANSGPVYIGSHQSGDYSKALIDDIRVYNGVLSAAQILRNYKATKSKHKNNIVSNWSDDFSDSFI